jgi:hypothetical protein
VQIIAGSWSQSGAKRTHEERRGFRTSTFALMICIILQLAGLDRRVIRWEFIYVPSATPFRVLIVQKYTYKSIYRQAECLRSMLV